MSSRLLFTLPCEKYLDKAYDLASDCTNVMVVEAYEIFLCDREPGMGHTASARVSDCGPFVIAMKKARPAELSEVQLKNATENH